MTNMRDDIGVGGLPDLVTRARVRVLAREWEGDSQAAWLNRDNPPRWFTDEQGYDIWLSSTEVDLWDLALVQLESR